MKKEKAKKERSGWRTVTKGKHKGVKVKYSRGYIDEVVNPKGKRCPVAIVQRGDYTGFTAISMKKPYRRIARGRKESSLIKRLVNKGHKKIEMRD